MLKKTNYKPYYEKKDVILCRSGFQNYSYNEIINMGLSAPQVKKDEYVVYRPASVVIAKKDSMANLPITREHPPEFINGENFQSYAHGYTGSEVEVVTIGEGEVGIKSNLMFATSDVYNYYLNGNKEVSLGYVAKYQWVDNSEEVGYDLLLVDIEDVNHLAVTSAGRGGSRVAIVDSILGGLVMFKTGLFHFLKKKGKTTDASVPFSKVVFDSLERSKSLDGDKLAQEAKAVLDSLATLKDTNSKALLLDSVADCYKAVGVALENKDAVAKFLDSTYEKAEKETLDGIESDEKKDNKPEEKKVEDAKDSEKKVEDTDDSEDKADKKEDKADKKEDKAEKKETKDEDGKGTGTGNVSDSVSTMIQDSIKAANASLLAEIDKRISSGIKDALGLSNNAQAAGGATADSKATVKDVDLDIARFVL